MDVKVLSRSEESLEDYDYHEAMEIHVNDKKVFSVSDGEPEDSNLSRDFSSCWNIPTIMKMAYEAGKNGEEFNLIEEDGDI